MIFIDGQDQMDALSSEHSQDWLCHDLRDEVEEFVPEAGGGEEPGAAVVETERGAGEGDSSEGVFVAAAENRLRDFVAEVGGHAYSVACVTEGEVQAVELAGVGHDVEGEIEGAAPDVLDFGFAQLGIDAEHATVKDFGAAADRAAGFREERGASAEKHAAVGGEAVVVQIILGIVDHAIART